MPLPAAIQASVFSEGAGGYHADTHMRCFLIMNASWWLIVPNLPELSLQNHVFLGVFACLAILFLAPVPNQNVRMSDAHRLKMRRIAVFLSMFYTILGVVLAYLGFYYSEFVVAGLMAIAVSMVCAMVKYKSLMKRK
ncbi:MAG: accessory gene regulator B family protein [Clostridiales bacterium]|nr:accessory gene regulator B family protein [Clostridiales bacterium]